MANHDLDPSHKGTPDNVTNPSQEDSETQPHSLPRDAFFKGASGASSLLSELEYSETSLPEIYTFVDGFSDNGLITLPGTKRYESDMLRASENATRRPFGVEVNTLSDNVQLVLYPRMIFLPDEWAEETAKEVGVEVRRSGPQAMLYPLDDVVDEAEDHVNNAANLLFMSHLVDGLLTSKYPVERDSHSPEFLEVLTNGLCEVRSYLEKLSPEQRADLTPRTARIGTMNDEQLGEYALGYVTYRVEDMKQHGLISSDGEVYKPHDVPGQTPSDAVAERREYLRLTDRDFKEFLEGEDTPSLPWREYGTNRYNRDHQLFGRYKHSDSGITVDFRLDTTHMPASYGFFDTIEIASPDADGEIKNHIILGQEVGGFFEVFPIIVAGEFPFQDPALKPSLDALISDSGTKPEIAKVIKDTINLDGEGELRRVPLNEE